MLKSILIERQYFEIHPDETSSTNPTSPLECDRQKVLALMGKLDEGGGDVLEGHSFTSSAVGITP